MVLLELYTDQFSQRKQNGFLLTSNGTDQITSIDQSKICLEKFQFLTKKDILS